MAGTRTAQTPLTIAVVIFFGLAFILGVTTYLYFDKAEKAELARSEATDQAAAAEAKAQKTDDDMRRLREIVGVAADVDVESIDTQMNGLFDGDFAGYSQDERSYLKLIEWLRQEYRDKNTRVKTVEEEKKSLAAQKAAELAAAEQAKQDALAAATAAKDTQSKEKADFEGRWKDHENELRKLSDARRTADEKSTDLEKLKAEIAKGLDYMSPARRTAFQAAITDGDSVKQLDVMRTELNGRRKTIADLNGLLAKLRVADPELQKEIAAARKADDRIDGFNGHVATVDPRTGTALISCRTTAGLRPGLVLHVFAPDDPRPEFGSRKAIVELTEVEGPTVARAVIRSENPRNPILPGDGVSSSLWAGGVAPDIVITGYADLDGDNRSDLAALQELVKRAGGRVVDAVAPNTALVVDLGQPPLAEDRREPPDWSAESKRRTRSLESAKAYNIRVSGIDELLDLLGLDAESYAPGRLPKARSVGRLPARQ
jgi:hypothetical protein